MLKDIKSCFGLMTSEDTDATEDSKLVLTDYELSKLENEGYYDNTNIFDNLAELTDVNVN